MLKMGLIGYGLWGKHHARALHQTDGIELCAIACASPASAAAARDDYPHVPVVMGYENLLGLAQIEAVAIVTPNHLHAEMTLAALKAGKDVLLEKPMALSVADCALINDLAKKLGRCVSLVHQFRLSTQWGAMKNWIDSGEMGEPLHAHISLFRFPYRPGSGAWRYSREEVGSWILEEPIHFFDSVMWYFEKLGNPISIQSTGNSRSGVIGMEENFSCMLRWSSGAYATITQTLSGFENHQVVELIGSLGAARGWWSGATDRTRQPMFELKRKRHFAESVETVEIGPSGELFELAETYRRIAAAFASKKPLVSGQEAAKRIHVCLEAERALSMRHELALIF